VFKFFRTGDGETQDVPKKNIPPFKLNILRQPRGSGAKLLIVFYRII